MLDQPHTHTDYRLCKAPSSSLLSRHQYLNFDFASISLFPISPILSSPILYLSILSLGSAHIVCLSFTLSPAQRCYLCFSSLLVQPLSSVSLFSSPLLTCFCFCFYCSSSLSLPLPSPLSLTSPSISATPHGPTPPTVRGELWRRHK